MAFIFKRLNFEKNHKTGSSFERTRSLQRPTKQNCWKIEIIEKAIDRRQLPFQDS